MLLAFIFVALAAALRLLPHPLHFTPVAAALLFFGARVDRKWMWAPILLLAAVDSYLTLARYHVQFSWLYFAVSLAWYAAIILVGTMLAKRESSGRIIGASLTASISFFLVSNAVSPWIIPGMYSHDMHGVVNALSAGVPFFRNTILSDLFFTALAFGTPYLIGAVERRTSGETIATA
ncbi:MAG: hypothetical protein NVS9B15_24070 [Acidobacteriaceae bacterium]